MASPVELARELHAPLATVAYHVRVLRDQGLIELVEEAPVRGTVEHYYRARLSDPVAAEDPWRDVAPSDAGDALGMVATVAHAAAAAGGFDSQEARLRFQRVRVDAKGFAQLARAYDRVLARVQDIVEGAERRTGSPSEYDDRADAGLTLLLFDNARLTAPE